MHFFQKVTGLGKNLIGCPWKSTWPNPEIGNVAKGLELPKSQKPFVHKVFAHFQGHLSAPLVAQLGSDKLLFSLCT